MAMARQYRGEYEAFNAHQGRWQLVEQLSWPVELRLKPTDHFLSHRYY
jgi:hypothetical protein